MAIRGHVSESYASGEAFHRKLCLLNDPGFLDELGELLGAFLVVPAFLSLDHGSEFGGNPSLIRQPRRLDQLGRFVLILLDAA